MHLLLVQRNGVFCYLNLCFFGFHCLLQFDDPLLQDRIRPRSGRGGSVLVGLGIRRRFRLLARYPFQSERVPGLQMVLVVYVQLRQHQLQFSIFVCQLLNLLSLKYV